MNQIRESRYSFTLFSVSSRLFSASSSIFRLFESNFPKEKKFASKLIDRWNYHEFFWKVKLTAKKNIMKHFVGEIGLIFRKKKNLYLKFSKVTIIGISSPRRIKLRIKKRISIPNCSLALTDKIPEQKQWNSERNVIIKWKNWSHHRIYNYVYYSNVLIQSCAQSILYRARAAYKDRRKFSRGCG